MNYKNLEGLTSKDLWGNKTEISKVEEDIIWIRTYRNHSHESCISRPIWRDDYYGEPTLKGGFERMKEELRICGFGIEESNCIRKENTDDFVKDYFSSIPRSTPKTFA